MDRRESTAVARTEADARADMAAAEEAYRRAWEEGRRLAALEQVRREIPNLERAVEGARMGVQHWQDHLAKLKELRRSFVAELNEIADRLVKRGFAGDEEPRLIRRRADLERAIDVLNGAPMVSTLVVQLLGSKSPRMPRTERHIADAQDGLTRAEAELVKARRQVA